ncbi:hypothetical protein ONZ51_g2300 [Trametes cubensis]|uniref:Uncharacterized protein n=1 Tax=Trametes cubensis TaxID=1111947 RepID=A0AAD7U269_9APHY|nr:hypothetical protein ONZ51_g2300 [Trametes cubensis]
MDRRGRSRDVSPAAIARTAFRDAGRAPPHPSFPRPPPAHSPYHPGPSKPSYHDSPDAISPFREHRASSSRLLSIPAIPPHHRQSLSSSPSDTLSRTHSSSSVLSTSSEPNPPEPLTPPDTGVVYAYACERPLSYYDSPPSPPRTLQDQMHVAYALENMHLAKVLLLKLRGIEVSGDDDPRIAQVRDEDFSSSFVPDGGLRLDDATEARVREAERRAKEAEKRRAREERLRRCERVWESSARRLKTEKERIAREREAEARARRRAELEARERERERARKEEAARAARQSQLRIASGHPRQLLCYDSLRNADARFPKPHSPVKDREDEGSGLFLYDIMPSPPSRPVSLSPPCSVSPTDKNSLSLPRAQREMALKHAKSLSSSVPFSDVLIAMHGPLFVEDVASRPHPRLRSHQAELLAMLLEPVDIVDIKGKSREDSLPSKATASQKRSHVQASAPARSSTLESIANHPLAPPAPPRPKAREPFALGRGRPLTRHSGTPGGQPSDDHSPPRASGLVHRVSRSVSSIMDFAAQFQKAYVKATMFSAGVDLYTQHARSDSHSRSASRSPSRSPVRHTRARCASVPVRGRAGGLKPEGYRVCAFDVQLFTAADRALEGGAPQLQRTLIPLNTPSVDSLPAHERVFPLPPPLPRSPFRPAAPPGSCLSRLRPVANPLMVAGLPLVKEKVLGVAWEGVGRSGLSWEVSVAY